jgi:hypothetical protein
MVTIWATGNEARAHSPALAAALPWARRLGLRCRRPGGSADTRRSINGSCPFASSRHGKRIRTTRFPYFRYPCSGSRPLTSDLRRHYQRLFVDVALFALRVAHPRKLPRPGEVPKSSASATRIRRRDVPTRPNGFRIPQRTVPDGRRERPVAQVLGVKIQEGHGHLPRMQ